MKRPQNLVLFIAIGVAIGAAMHNIAIGIAIGTAMGIMLDARLAKLNPQEKESTDKKNNDYVNDENADLNNRK